MASELKDLKDLLEIISEENDENALDEVMPDIESLEKKFNELEFKRMFSKEMDPNNAYMDIQSGSGGTEAQDWAEMLLRMYLRWSEQH